MSVNYAENGTGPVGSPVYAQDPERRGVNWRVEGVDAGDFEVTTSNNVGTLRFKNSPDFEDPQDADANNLYTVSVRAVDPGGRESAATTFNVLVTNVEEPGEVIVSHNGDEPWYGGLQPKVGVELLAYATDPDDILDDVDTTADDVTWQWYRGDQSSTACSDTVSDNCLIEGADESAYTPVVGDVGMRLTAAASYFDKEDSTMRKAAASKSMYATRAAGANRLPTFEQDQTSLVGNTPYGSDINTLIDLMPLDATAGTANDVVVQLEIKEDAEVGAMVGPGPIAATDPDEGDELTYSIENETPATAPALGPVQFFAIDRATGQITLKKEVDTEAAGDPCGTNDQCLVTVTATDSAGDPGGTDRVQIDVRIDIINVNELPMITGDNAVSVDENTTDIDAVLDVEGDATTTGQQNYGATDVDLPGGTAQTLTWTLSGADAALFGFGAPADPHPDTITGAAGDLQFSTAPDFEDPKDANKDNTYEVTLNVSDGTDTATKEVKVTVKNRLTVDGTETGDEDEPGTVTLSHIQPRVGVRFTATLTDDDGGIRSASWQWSIDGSGASTPAGDISGATSATYTPTAGDVGGTLTATVTYLDSTSEDQTQTRTAMASSATAVVAALATNSRPTFAENRYARQVAENAAADTAVTDPDGGDAFILAADDNVTDGGDLVEFSISGADSEYFDVGNDNTGAGNLQADITIKAPLNYEVPKDADRNNIYVFTLTATDSSGGRGTTTVSVTVTDVPETLTATDDTSTMRVAENSPLRTNVGEPIQPTNPGDSTYQTYALNDATADSGEGDYFRIHRDDGQIFVNDDLDYEAAPCGTDSVCSVTVTITGYKTDDEGNTVEAGEDTTGAINITITDVNEAPSYATAQTRYVAENAWKLENEEYIRDTKTGKPATMGSTLVLVTADDPSATESGPDMDLYRTTAPSPTVASAGIIPAHNNPDRVAATDPERRVITDLRATANERLLYTLSGPDAMYFGIYRGTGQIITQALLDYETLQEDGKTSFSVQVTATDRAGLSDTTDVTIHVVDVNEPPIPIEGLSISAGPSQMDHAENSDAAIGAYEVDGRNAETANWSVEGEDGSLFMVSPASGMSTTLRFRSAPDYEAPMGGANDDSNSYMVTVKATDSTDNTVSDTRDVVVTVSNVDEDGTVTLSTESPVVGVEVTASGPMDPDGGVTGTTWQWARGDNGVYSDIAGETSASYTPVAGDVGMTLRAMASYADREGMGKTAMDVTDNAVVMLMVSGDDAVTIEENVASVGNYTASVSGATWSLGGPDAALFGIAGGALSFDTAPDYEMPADDGGDNMYNVTVVASYGTATPAELDVTVTVTDVEESVSARYDDNNDGQISLPEMFDAIDDYFDGHITLPEMFEVIDAYFDANG